MALSKVRFMEADRCLPRAGCEHNVLLQHHEFISLKTRKDLNLLHFLINNATVSLKWVR